MKQSTENWLTRIFIVAYVLTCLAAVLAEDKNNNEMYNNQKTLCIIQCVDDEATLYWLDGLLEDGDPDSPADYVVAESKAINYANLCEILDKKFYIEFGNDKPMGMFMPIAKIQFDSVDGCCEMLFSFANAEARLYMDGNFQKAWMLYNPETLYGLMEKY